VTLPDVGVLLAAVWGKHVHHPVAQAWLDRQHGGLVLCRVTQMSLLRLLSNPAVMGADLVSRALAWGILDQLSGDERVVWSDEPQHMEPVWRALSARDDNSHKLWTDDYLAAFAQAGGLTLATLDSGFQRRYPSVAVETLV
jgi:uncharacterized protein